MSISGGAGRTQRWASLTIAVDEYIKRVVSEAPPLSDEQKRRIGALLGVAEARIAPTDAEREVERARLERAEREAETRRLSRALLACGICGVPREGHHRSFTQQHDFVPLNDEQVRKVIGA